MPSRPDRHVFGEACGVWHLLVVLGALAAATGCATRSELADLEQRVIVAERQAARALERADAAAEATQQALRRAEAAEAAARVLSDRLEAGAPDRD